MDTKIKKEVNLPKTEFQMKGNLPSLQKQILEKELWISTSDNKEGIVVHDGPPYANGNIHIGHAYNKFLKDILCRYLNYSSGTIPNFVCGWDCHGLPIELAVEKQIKEATIESCKTYADQQILNQKEQFKKLGISIEHFYKTSSSEFENIELESFRELYKKGLIKTGFKPVHWCWSCQTSLAEHELEYKTVSDNSVYVLFPSEKEPSLSFLIWTTTPWTLKANKAIGINKHLTYVVVTLPEINKPVVVSEYFAKNTLKLEKHQYQNLDTKILLRQFYLDSFGEVNEKRPIFHANYILESTGTGLVHIAPNCGKEDYLSFTKEYSLQKIENYTDTAGLINGIFYKKANKIFVEELKTKQNYWKENVVEHEYPHCWRCKNPTIQRATKQVFLDYECKKELILKEAENLNFYPTKSKTRFLSFLNNRTEWCLSRQRKWGVPIPMFNCLSCGKNDQLCLKSSVETWRSKEYKPKCDICGSFDTLKSKDILDVWFDSGLTYKTLPNFISDFVIEGSDQHRGWFQSSHILSCLLENKSCFRTIVSHGFVLDENNRKMSKSEGNVVDPIKLLETYGSDILRLWVVSQKVGDDILIGENLLKQQATNYRKIRNIIRFLLSNLYDFDLQKQEEYDFSKKEIEELTEIQKDFVDSFKEFEMNRFMQKFMNYLDKLSTSYFEMSKKILYESPKNSTERKSVQNTFYKIIEGLENILTILIPFTMTEFSKFKMKEIGSEK